MRGHEVAMGGAGLKERGGRERERGRERGRELAVVVVVVVVVVNGGCRGSWVASVVFAVGQGCKLQDREFVD